MGRQLNKCLASRNPVRIEPGRYTVILEPQAFYQLVWPLFDPQLNLFERALRKRCGRARSKRYFCRRKDERDGRWASHLHGDSRLKRIADRRISIGQDPLTLTGNVSLADGDNPYKPVTWVDHGYSPHWSPIEAALISGENEGFPNNGAFKVSFDGLNNVMEEMIASNSNEGSARNAVWSAVHHGPWERAPHRRDPRWIVAHREREKSVSPFGISGVAESPFFVLNRSALGLRSGL